MSEFLKSLCTLEESIGVRFNSTIGNAVIKSAATFLGGNPVIKSAATFLHGNPVIKCAATFLH